VTNGTTKGVSISPKNWKNFRERFETSFLTKKIPLGSAGIQVSREGGRDYLIIITI
jgi:hypothetical protein